MKQTPFSAEENEFRISYMGSMAGVAPNGNNQRRTRLHFANGTAGSKNTEGVPARYRL